MSAIMFLLGAVIVAAIGITVLHFVNREPPKSSLSSIDDFMRQKEALAPKKMPTSRIGEQESE